MVYGFAIGLGILVTFLLGVGVWQEVIAASQETVALVYGEQVLAGELLGEARLLSRQLEQQAKLLRGRGLEKALESQRPLIPDQALNNLVERRLIRREAAQGNIAVTNEDVVQTLRTRMALRAAQTAAEPGLLQDPSQMSDDDFARTYQVFLAEIGLGDQSYRRIVRDELLRQRLQEALATNVPATAPQVQARHILVESEEKALEVRSRLESGASFEELARAESVDTATRDKGGDLGWFPRGIMNADFENAAFSQSPGTVAIVRSSNGYHLLGVLERVEQRPVEPQHQELLKSRKYTEWLNEARRSPQVSVQLTSEQRAWVFRRLNSPI